MILSNFEKILDVDGIHTGNYFFIIKLNNKYYLYYFYTNDALNINSIKLVISDNLNFNYNNSIVVMEKSPGGVFSIINNNDTLYMLNGYHCSNKEHNEIEIPDLVWTNNRKTILDWNKSRDDFKNGMYLFKSNNGIDWIKIHELPVLHSYISSDTCQLGSVCFDTRPCLIFYKNEYILFSRLNTALDERGICIRKSKNLIDWTLPEKINILNENSNNTKKNYYHFVVFEKNNILYAFAPYFEACGTENRNYTNGHLILLESINLLNWRIIEYKLPHLGKTIDRVNDILIENDKLKIFFRKNIGQRNQCLYSLDLNI